jgi:hypothetical protein
MLGSADVPPPWAVGHRAASESSWIGRVGLTGNRLLLYAIAFETAMLATFLLVPSLPELLGGTTPSALGWTLAALVVPVVWFADAPDKALRA